MSLTIRPTMRRSALLGIAAALAITALAFANPPNASAGTNYFCYANGNYKYIGANGYCVGNGYNDLWQVRYSLQNGSGVEHCALSKIYSDGSGSNIHDAGCGPDQHEYSQCYNFSSAFSPLYPKGTNESSSPHYYRGAAAYGQCF